MEITDQQNIDNILSLETDYKSDYSNIKTKITKFELSNANLLRYTFGRRIQHMRAWRLRVEFVRPERCLGLLYIRDEYFFSVPVMRDGIHSFSLLFRFNVTALNHPKRIDSVYIAYRSLARRCSLGDQRRASLLIYGHVFVLGRRVRGSGAPG